MQTRIHFISMRSHSATQFVETGAKSSGLLRRKTDNERLLKTLFGEKPPQDDAADRAFDRLFPGLNRADFKK